MKLEFLLTIAGCAIALTSSGQTSEAPTAKADDRPMALKVVEDAASNFCISPPLNQQSTHTELTGDAKFKLSNIIKQIADIGVSGAIKYENGESQGVLQKDLAKSLKDSMDCKLTVLSIFKEYLLLSLNDDHKEKDSVQNLIDYLCNRGVLQNKLPWEFPPAVKSSLQDIQKHLADTLSSLPSDSVARGPIQAMEQAARLPLQNPAVFPKKANMARPVEEGTPLANAIHVFRASYAQNTAKLIESYSLTGNCTISDNL